MLLIMITFILTIFIAEVIKNNSSFIEKKLKKTSRYLFSRLYTVKKEVKIETPVQVDEDSSDDDSYFITS